MSERENLGAGRLSNRRRSSILKSTGSSASSSTTTTTGERVLQEAGGGGGGGNRRVSFSRSKSVQEYGVENPPVATRWNEPYEDEISSLSSCFKRTGEGEIEKSLESSSGDLSDAAEMSVFIHEKDLGNKSNPEEDMDLTLAQRATLEASKSFFQKTISSAVDMDFTRVSSSAEVSGVAPSPSEKRRGSLTMDETNILKEDNNILNLATPTRISNSEPGKPHHPFLTRQSLCMDETNILPNPSPKIICEERVGNDATKPIIKVFEVDPQNPSLFPFDEKSLLMDETNILSAPSPEFLHKADESEVFMDDVSNVATPSSENMENILGTNIAADPVPDALPEKNIICPNSGNVLMRKECLESDGKNEEIFPPTSSSSELNLLKTKENNTLLGECEALSLIVNEAKSDLSSTMKTVTYATPQIDNICIEETKIHSFNSRSVTINEENSLTVSKTESDKDNITKYLCEDLEETRIPHSNNSDEEEDIDELIRREALKNVNSNSIALIGKSVLSSVSMEMTRFFSEENNDHLVKVSEEDLDFTINTGKDDDDIDGRLGEKEFQNNSNESILTVEVEKGSTTLLETNNFSNPNSVHDHNNTDEILGQKGNHKDTYVSILKNEFNEDNVAQIITNKSCEPNSMEECHVSSFRTNIGTNINHFLTSQITSSNEPVHMTDSKSTIIPEEINSNTISPNVEKDVSTDEKLVQKVVSNVISNYNTVSLAEEKQFSDVSFSNIPQGSDETQVATDMTEKKANIPSKEIEEQLIKSSMESKGRFSPDYSVSRADNAITPSKIQNIDKTEDAFASKLNESLNKSGTCWKSTIATPPLRKRSHCFKDKVNGDSEILLNKEPRKILKMEPTEGFNDPQKTPDLETGHNKKEISVFSFYEKEQINFKDTYDYADYFVDKVSKSEAVISFMQGVVKIYFVLGEMMNWPEEKEDVTFFHQHIESINGFYKTSSKDPFVKFVLNTLMRHFLSDVQLMKFGGSTRYLEEILTYIRCQISGASKMIISEYKIAHSHPQAGLDPNNPFIYRVLFSGYSYYFRIDIDFENGFNAAKKKVSCSLQEGQVNIDFILDLVKKSKCSWQFLEDYVRKIDLYKKYLDEAYLKRKGYI